MRKGYQKYMEVVLFICAFLSVAMVVMIIVFIFGAGLPLFKKVGLRDFLFSTNWLPSSRTNPSYGILSFIIGSLYVTFGALILAIPLGLLTAIFLSELATPKMNRILCSAVQLLAGIPSVIYGFFGVMVISPQMRKWFGGTGYGVLSASIVLAIMILPTIISLSEVAISSVPKGYREASLALGASKWQTIMKVLLPSARSGIFAAVGLAMGRAVGETTAVLMVGGNAPIMPEGLTSMVRTLTMNIATDMGYASGIHRTALFATGVILFLFIMILNIFVQLMQRKVNKKE
nr:phosphate ABC transporter permease subunit PstC [Xylanivirga thermophila]